MTYEKFEERDLSGNGRNSEENQSILDSIDDSDERSISTKAL